MKIQKLTILTILGVALLTACEKEIEFNGEQTESKLVINSLVEPGKPIVAKLSKSVFFLDNEANTEAPDDLVATLYVNDNSIGEMTLRHDTVWNEYVYDDYGNLDSSYYLIPAYTSPYIPVVGDVIKIMASANGFDDVEGETSPLPNEVDWHPIGLETNQWEVSYYDYEGDTSWYISCKMQLLLEIIDANPGKTDYYKLYVSVGGFSDEGTGSRFYISTTYNDPVFGGTGTEEYDEFNIDLLSRPEGVFTDVLFDGRSYTVKLPLFIYIDFYGTLPDSFQLPMQLEHLSKEYYYYLNTCEQGDELSQFFAEPMQTYSNVKGGYGVVGGRMVDTLEVTVPIREIR